jgi:hypothetical protein
LVRNPYPSVPQSPCSRSATLPITPPPLCQIGQTSPQSVTLLHHTPLVVSWNQIKIEFVPLHATAVVSKSTPFGGPARIVRVNRDDDKIVSFDIHEWLQTNGFRNSPSDPPCYFYQADDATATLVVKGGCLTRLMLNLSVGFDLEAQLPRWGRILAQLNQKLRLKVIPSGANHFTQAVGDGLVWKRLLEEKRNAEIAFGLQELNAPAEPSGLSQEKIGSAALSELPEHRMQELNPITVFRNGPFFLAFVFWSFALYSLFQIFSGQTSIIARISEAYGLDEIATELVVLFALGIITIIFLRRAMKARK